MYRNLSEFISALDRAGELKRIRSTVSPHLEISRFTDAESKRPGGGKALFFEKVEGSAFPVATNLFGSSRRICMALGVDDLDRLAGRIKSYIDLHPPRHLRDALSLLPMAINLTKFFPRTSRAKIPPCQQVVYKGDSVRLSRLPVLHCWPQDAGRFVTLPLVITRSPISGKRNVGMYRMQIFDDNTTGMHWHVHKDGSHYYNEYARLGRRMPVAVAIGADPATVYAATAPMPRGVDEMILAGFIRQKPVRMAKCLTVDLEVPAEAEFVLEGYVDPGELRTEGPFGDHTGYYSLADEYPVFHVTALTHRRDPVYNATLVGRPPMEDCYLAKATERLFLPMLQTVFPEIRDYWFPWEGVFHNIVVVAIEKEYAGHALKVMSGLWGQGQMSFCKAIVVVDETVDCQDPGQVLEAFLTRLDMGADITITRGVLDVLDHASPFANFGSKIGIDLTPRLGNEPERQGPGKETAPADGDPATAVKARITEAVQARQWVPGQHLPAGGRHRILAVAIDKSTGAAGAAVADELLALSELNAYGIFVLFDRDIDLEETSLMLWKVFNNVDPGRDVVVKGRRLCVDATVKGPVDGHERQWPDALSFDP